MKQKLNTGVEVYDNKAKKNNAIQQTNEKPNIYINLFNKNNSQLILSDVIFIKYI